MKRMMIVAAALSLATACGGAVDDNSATKTASTEVDGTPSTSNERVNNSSTSSTTQPRDVRDECSAELARLEECGQATATEREQIDQMLCKSTDYTDGQVATVTNCLSQWTCGSSPPACLQESDPQPECQTDADCADPTPICSAGVCQPDAVAACTSVRYDAGELGDGTKQLRQGETCTFPGECLSNRCVTATGSSGDSQSWCGAKGDCRNPNNADEECPSGYACEEVLRSTFDDNPIWTCVRPGIGEVCR